MAIIVLDRFPLAVTLFLLKFFLWNTWLGKVLLSNSVVVVVHKTLLHLDVLIWTMVKIIWIGHALIVCREVSHVGHRWYVYLGSVHAISIWIRSLLHILDRRMVVGSPHHGVVGSASHVLVVIRRIIKEVLHHLENPKMELFGLFEVLRGTQKLPVLLIPVFL